MKTLPHQFDHQSHMLTLIERTETAGFYRTTRQGESLVGYIVAKIGTRQGGTRTFPDGRTIMMEDAEFLPTENDFGRSAWFFRDEQIARNRFLALCKTQEARFRGQGIPTQPSTLTPA